MNPKPTLTIAAGILVAAMATVVSGQSVFPIDWDPDPVTGAMGIGRPAGLTVEQATHYEKTFTYSVDPMSPIVNILDITATTDDTIVLIRVLATMTKADDVAIGTLKERLIKGRWDADALGGGGQWNSQETGSGFGTGSVSVTVAGSGPLEIHVAGGSDELLHTVMLEVIANHGVTYAEFTDPT